MADSVFRADGASYLATAHARGPWEEGALHGGAPAALIATAFERLEPGSHLPVARLSFELLRPIPFEPLSLATRIVRNGRRVQELAAELRAGEQLVCRASAVRVQPVAAEVAGAVTLAAPLPPPMPGPEQATPVRFALDDASRDSFATGMEMRWLDDPASLGPARVWMRLRHPLLPGEPASPLARVAATADFGNGVSAALPFEQFVFINADLSIHLRRRPEGEWIGLDAATALPADGIAVAESVVHDERGPVGRSFQTLVVGPRETAAGAASRDPAAH